MYVCKIYEATQEKYEIIELLSREHNIKLLCGIMKVPSLGYYKCFKNKDVLNNYKLNRKELGVLIRDIHKRKTSYGYYIINKITRYGVAGMNRLI